MSGDSSKLEKKRAKAEVKRAKAEAKAMKSEAKYGAKTDQPAGSPLLRFVREGLFQTIIKVIAGLIVAYLLIRLGLR